MFVIKSTLCTWPPASSERRKTHSYIVQITWGVLARGEFTSVSKCRAKVGSFMMICAQLYQEYVWPCALDTKGMVRNETKPWFWYSFHNVCCWDLCYYSTLYLFGNSLNFLMSSWLEKKIPDLVVTTDSMSTCTINSSSFTPTALSCSIVLIQGYLLSPIQWLSGYNFYFSAFHLFVLEHLQVGYCQCENL